MLRNSPFIHKVLNRIDRVDRQSLKQYLQDIAQDHLLLQDVFNEAQEGIVILQRDGTLQYMNRQAAIWLGVERLQKENASIYDFIPESELSDFLQDHLAVMKDQVIQNIRLLSPREVGLRACLTRLTQNNHQHVLLLLVPVIADASAWNERLARIESLVKLAAGIAHEIGNPLNSIGIHLQLLKKETAKLPAAKRKGIGKTIEVLQSETERLDHIVRNFLKATRKPPLRFKVENLNGILEDALTFLMPELKRNKIHVKFKKDPGLVSFMMDRERLYQTFINIIKNAMEAMPKGGPLRISVTSEKQLVSIHFKDKGQGIPQKDLPHIFDAYYTTKPEGSGLGLMTVFDTVREHGGRIGVDTQLKRGTDLTIHLPIRTPQLQIPQIRGS